MLAGFDSFEVTHGGVPGHSLACGHYLAEEAPALLLEPSLEFFRREI
jgi:hypothetical protein